MTALTEERKQQIIAEEPVGLWLVLNEEYPRDVPTIVGLLGGNADDAVTNQPRPLSLAVPADAFGATAVD